MLRLKELREEKKLQQKDLAEKMNRTIACISSWETGKTEPSIDDLIALSTILDVTIDYLVSKTDEFGNNISTLSNMETEFLNYFNHLSLASKYQTLGFMKSLTTENL